MQPGLTCGSCCAQVDHCEAGLTSASELKELADSKAGPLDETTCAVFHDVLRITLQRNFKKRAVMDEVSQFYYQAIVYNIILLTVRRSFLYGAECEVLERVLGCFQFCNQFHGDSECVKLLLSTLSRDIEA